MRIESDIKLGFKDVMFRPKRSTLKSRSEVSLNREFSFKHSNNKWEGVPIIAANMDTVGTFEIAKSLHKSGLITAIHKHYSIREWADFMSAAPLDIVNHFAVSTGTSLNDSEKLNYLLAHHPQIKFICIDVANGYSQHFVDYVKSTRDQHPDKVIMAGNVVTGEMVEELLLSGADIIKVGIGPGSVCTTRIKTGVGYPQLSAVIECADAAHGIGGQIISDGGCKIPGDIAKAFGGGADFVMLGGMLAGHDESGGDMIEENGKKYKLFYGMSSKKAMEKHYGKMESYRSSEGRVVRVPYKGPVEDTIKNILGGIRSCMTYIGAKKLKNLPKCTTFIRVNNQLNNIYSHPEYSIS